MAADNVLTKVKEGLGITTIAQDNTLEVYIQAVKDYMKDAGVSKTLLASDSIIGAVVIGVSDLWNYNSGGSKFSPYFVQRVIQLATKKEEEPEEGESTEGE